MPELHQAHAHGARHLPALRPREGGRAGRAAPQAASGGGFWAELDDAFWFGLWFAPGLALLIVVLVFVASDLLLLAALALLLAPVVAWFLRR